MLVIQTHYNTLLGLSVCVSVGHTTPLSAAVMAKPLEMTPCISVCYTTVQEWYNITLYHARHPL